MKRKNIGENVSKQHNFLQSILKTKSQKIQTSLIKNASADELLAIVECCANVLKAKFTLTERQKRRLSQHAQFLRKLARVRSERSARRLLQHGSGIPAVVALITPIVAELARAIISNL